MPHHPRGFRPIPTYLGWISHPNIQARLMETYRGKYGFNAALVASILARRTRSLTALIDIPNLWVNGNTASVLNSCWMFSSFAAPILRCLASCTPSALTLYWPSQGPVNLAYDARHVTTSSSRKVETLPLPQAVEGRGIMLVSMSVKPALVSRA